MNTVGLEKQSEVKFLEWLCGEKLDYQHHTNTMIKGTQPDKHCRRPVFKKSNDNAPKIYLLYKDSHAYSKTSWQNGGIKCFFPS